MKFESLKVERFGSLADFELQFDVDAPMQVLFGPNEAGKSTFLGLMRELLFGFPHSGSAYHYSGTGRQIAAEAQLRMADLTTIHFRREKGAKNCQVRGEADPSGETIDDTSLLRRLGGISQPFYENVFGFSLGELASGEKSLEEANLDEALYGTGLGGLRGLQAVQAELTGESDKLWLARGRKQKINDLLAKVKISNDSLRAATLRPDEYEARLEQHRQAVETFEKIRSENEASRRMLKHLERLRDSLGPYQELTVMRRKLQKLQAESSKTIDRFPRDGRQEMDDLLREIKTSQRQLAERDRQITEATDRIDSLDCRPTLVEQESKIRQLFQTLKQIRDYRDDIPRLEQELDSIRRQVLATINELDPSWTIETLDRYHVSLDRRTQIEEMADQWNKIEEQRSLNQQQFAVHQKNLDADLARLEAISSTVESTELSAIMERQADYTSDQRKCHEFEEQLEGLHWKTEEASRKLFCVAGLDHEGLDRLTVPLEETVREFDQQLEEAKQAAREAGERLRQAEEELGQLKAERNEKEATGTVPTRQELDESRAVRSEGWRLLRRRFIESKKVADKHFKTWIETVKAGNPTALLAASDVSAETEADLYESMVKRTDDLADERQNKAELVALLDSLNRRIMTAERQGIECRERFEQAEAVHCELLSRWRAIWKPCDLTPLLPEEMLRWLENYASYLDLLGEIKSTEVRVDSIERRLERFGKELRQTCIKTGLLPKSKSSKKSDIEKEDEPVSTETLLVTVRQYVDQCRETQAERRTIQNRLPELKSELKQLDQAHVEFDQKADDWTCRWAEFLEQLELPTDWTSKVADATLSRLHEVRHEHQKIDPMEKRLGEIHSHVEQFDRQTRDLCSQIAEDFAPLPSEQAVESLHARLEEAKGAVIEKRTAMENRDAATQQKSTIELQLAEFRTACNALLDAIGVESEEVFYEVASCVENHQALLTEIQNLTDQIDRFITNEEQADAFWKELEKTDADTFELVLDQARREDARISDARDEAASEKSLAAKTLDELDQTDQAARAAAQLESDRSKLREAVDRWATLSVARTLIEDAVRRFERENQPEMLEDIRHLFAVMTGNRYTEVRRRMNEQGTLVVVEQGGLEKVPSQLSTGTREQLYLAMRLAYVIHYCRRNEPLPLVMDDVLVNFDATRAAGTVDALAEVARATQIIFLTCHKHTVDLIAARLPGAPVCQIGYN